MTSKNRNRRQQSTAKDLLTGRGPDIVRLAVVIAPFKSQERERGGQGGGRTLINSVRDPAHGARSVYCCLKRDTRADARVLSPVRRKRDARYAPARSRLTVRDLSWPHNSTREKTPRCKCGRDSREPRRNNRWIEDCNIKFIVIRKETCVSSIVTSCK